MSDSEAAAKLENEAVEAMMELVADYGYTEDDLNNMVITATRG